VSNVLDEETVETLVDEFGTIIRNHFRAGPIHRNRVLEILNALAISVSSIVVGCDDPEAGRFFELALNQQMEDICPRKQ
jgi:hypothetical protein